MNEKTKNWVVFSITLVISLLFLIWCFPVFWGELIYFLTFREFPRISLVIAFPYLSGLFLGAILPTKFLQRWLLIISSLILSASMLILLSSFFEKCPAVASTPEFCKIHRLLSLAENVGIIFLFTLGLYFMIFFKKIITEKG